MLSSFFLYSFSIPYLFLIKLWGGIFPSSVYNLGNEFYLNHLGFGLTMISFIFFPFIFFYSQNLIEQAKIFFKKREIYFLVIMIIAYVIGILFFYDNSFFNNRLDGGGIVKKLSFIFFDDTYLRKIFILLSFFFCMVFYNLFFK